MTVHLMTKHKCL